MTYDVIFSCGPAVARIFITTFIIYDLYVYTGGILILLILTDLAVRGFLHHLLKFGPI